MEFDDGYYKERAKVAQMLLERFCEWRRTYIASFKPNRQISLPDFWYPAAEYCMDFKIEPKVLIDSVIEMSGMRNPPSKWFRKKETLDNYYKGYAKRHRLSDKKQSSNECLDLVYLLNYFLQIARTRFNSYNIPVVQTLADDSLHTIPAFVRIILCKDNADIVKKYSELAKEELYGNVPMQEQFRKFVRDHGLEVLYGI